MENPKIRKERKDKGKLRKLSEKDVRRLKATLKKNPGSTSKDIFSASGVADVSKSTRNSVLGKFAKQKKATITPPLTPKDKERRLDWAKRYMRTSPKLILFTDECRATLDGPDGWSKGWVFGDDPSQMRLRRQQGGGGVMFLAGIIGDVLIGPVNVQEGVKLDSKRYCEFIDSALSDWLDDLPLEQRRKIIFMQGNAPSHAAKKTKEFLHSLGFKNNTLMDWPACSPDLNPIENLWAIIKRSVYSNGKQYSSKNDLWAAIQNAAKAVDPSTIKKLTDSVTERMFQVIKSQGSHIGK